MTDRPLLRTDPRSLGSWKTTARLGVGATGVVYRGVDDSGDSVAIKVLRPDAAADANFRARFRHEAEVLASIDSPRVARLLTADLDAGVPYLVTEFIDGPNVAEYVHLNGPLGGDALLAFAHELAEGIADVHRAGFVHRDLKPDNIVMGRSRPILVDFGLAISAEPTDMTQVSDSVGTPGWVAPEQLSGADAGLASDVFVWAALVAFAGSGEPPFGTGAAVSMMYRIVHDEPTLDRLDPLVECAVRPGLVKDPMVRPSLSELLGLLAVRPLEHAA